MSNKDARDSRDGSYIPGTGRSTATNTPIKTSKKSASTRSDRDTGRGGGRSDGGVLVSSSNNNTNTNRDNNRYISTESTNDDHNDEEGEVDMSYD